MYNGGGALTGGGLVLAATGGASSMMPMIVAMALVAIGALLVVRDRWLKNKQQVIS